MAEEVGEAGLRRAGQAAGSAAVVVLDIEGTVGDVRFVREVLFPYAREAFGRFIAERGAEPEVQGLLDEVRRLVGEPHLGHEALVAQLRRWVDEDRKLTPLKALQGLLWAEGFRRGDFRAHVYPEVPGVLRAWRDQGRRLFVYSSGSVPAQKLYFAHSTAGDLTPLFEGYFDTSLGPKIEPSSYRALAACVGVPPEHLVFLSDSLAELDAARAVGVMTIGLARDGQPSLGTHPVATTLTVVMLEHQTKMAP